MPCRPSIVKKTPVMKESHQLRDNEPQTIEKHINIIQKNWIFVESNISVVNL